MPAGLMSALLEASSQPFEAIADGYRAHSGGLELTLNAAGVQASGAGLAWRLALTSLGRGEWIAPLAAADMRQAGDCLEIDHGTLTEWYRDTALGLEQGLTVHRPPAGSGALVLRLALSGELSGALDEDRRGLTLTSAGGQTLRYDHLRAWDTEGLELNAALDIAADQVTIEVDDRGAAYPITVNSLVYFEKVVGPGSAGDAFGTAVALSYDGNTALVGAPYDDVGDQIDQGSAYVFTRSGTSWTQQAQLIALDGATDDEFGSSVALSLAGDMALVGATGDDGEGGSAYVFTRSGTTWTQQAKLTAADGAAGDQFGHAVALSSSFEGGDTALVGAPYDDVGAQADQGSAYVFTRSDTTWTQRAQLAAAGGATGDEFGHSVALIAVTALVGAVGDDAGQGSAYVFLGAGATWNQQARLTAADGAAGDLFGGAVALSYPDGSRALVGAEEHDVGENDDQGAAYVFARSGTTWTQQAQLTASDGTSSEYFGFAVAIAGGTALVSAPSDDGAGTNYGQGSAYVFTRSDTTWTQQTQLIAPDGAAWDSFGVAVALSGDGETALVGVDYDDVGNNVETADQGSAYVFSSSDTAWKLQAQLVSARGTAGARFGVSVALADDTALVGAYWDEVEGNVQQGSAYVFTRSGMIWVLQQQLIALYGSEEDQFGRSVALSSDGNTALVGANYSDVYGANEGSAYVFVRSGTTWTEQARLTASDCDDDDGLGVSVALSSDGNTALVGADHDDVGGNADQGSAYVFVRSDTTWLQQARLTLSSGMPSEHLGYSVALSGDGNTALLGMFSNLEGLATVFTRSSTTWTQRDQLTASDGTTGDYFGASVALSVNGNTALVGAFGDDVGIHTDQGSAYVFARGDTVWTQQAHLTAADGAANDGFGMSVALSGNAALVGAKYDDIGEDGDQGSAYLFTRSDTTWTQQSQLTASDGAAGDYFGVSAALSDDGHAMLVGAYWDDVGAQNEGSAYFYTLPRSTYLPLVLRNAP